MENQTKAIDLPFCRRDAYGSLSMPIYHTAAYEFDTATDMADAFTGKVLAPDYSRVMNPTVTYLEEKVKAITDASRVFALCSGMAAISNTMLALAAEGKNIVTSRHLFGNSFALLNSSLPRFGVEARFCDLTDPHEVERNIDDDTCCIFLEIITNPQCEVADLSALAQVAHKMGVPLVADTTMIPFTEFSAHSLGVDIEIVSSTKYLSGGGTSLGGLVVDYGTTEGFSQRMFSEMLFNFGAYMAPHAAYMQTLGLETLHARYRMQAENTLTLAQRMRSIEGIRSVNYVGLPDNPYHTLAQRQFGHTAGAMLTIDLDSRDACFKFIDKLQLIRRATNLFDNRTLAIHPASTIFGNFSDDERADMDVLDTTIRLSVGLEDTEDLLNDIKQALS